MAPPPPPVVASPTGARAYEVAVDQAIDASPPPPREPPRGRPRPPNGRGLKEANPRHMVAPPEELRDDAERRLEMERLRMRMKGLAP